MNLPIALAASMALPSLTATSAPGVSQSYARMWAGAALMNEPAEATSMPAGLEVVRQDYGISLAVRKSIMNTPLQIGDRRYKHGIGTHSFSEIIVRLPKRGKQFRAEMGVDNNHDTKGHLGSVNFSVEIAGKEVFRSDVLRGGGAPVPVKIDLNGASEFTLKVSDGGDGSPYDQSDWADARVTLEDGSKLWLDEMAVMDQPARFSTGIPFSFTYGGRPSSEFLSEWSRTDSRSTNGDRDICISTFTDPVTGLEVRCETTAYNGVPAVDWVLYLRNTGPGDTPIIENLLPLDVRISAPARGDVVFHHSHGSACTSTDFLPMDDPVPPGAEFSLAPVEGRSSDTTLPFFDLQWGGGGVVGAIGWSGQWSLNLKRDGGSGLTLQSGQEATHLKLHPGEMIRTPRIVLLMWQGDDWLTGQNQFRHLVLDRYTPKADGKPVFPPITQNTWFTYNTGNDVTEKNQLEIINSMSKLGVEAYWLDAGWFEGGWPEGAGNWVPRADGFPRGLKPLSDSAHKKGMKFVLWFEPERVVPGSRISREHPEWVMHVPADQAKLSNQDLLQNELFNLGNPDARQWLTDVISKCVDDYGIDVYRQDFNIFGTLRFWKAADAPDRQGMAENLHIQGLYAMWDELRRRHPGLAIDNCASGGRRIDLELICRSYPLWRSDTQCCGRPMPVWDQVQTAGLSLYVPFHSAAVWSTDPYVWRSVATTGTNICMDTTADGFDSAAARRIIEETKSLRPFWQGDYYPLLPITLDTTQWVGWQFDRPDLGKGFAMLFRRPESAYASLDCSLHAIDLKAQYEVTFVDTKKTRTMSGKALSRLRVTIDKAPGSLLITYARRK